MLLYVEYPPKRLQCCLVVTWLVPRETFCRLGTSCSSLQCHFIRSYMRRMHVCLAVTCLMRVIQNCQDLLPATAVARGWNGCRNKSQHKNQRRKLFCRSCRDSNLRPFDRESVALILNHPLSPIHTMQLTGIFHLQTKRVVFQLELTPSLP